MMTKVEKKQSVQKARFVLQIGMASLWIWIGFEFYFFVKYLETNGASGTFYRPPGVDGFLPISSLMNLAYVMRGGALSMIHPAGIFIFLSIIFMSLVFGKSFCSWFCAIGTLSENLANLGQRLFKRKIKMPKIIDVVLRAIKYLLLLFFCLAIFLMNTETLGLFLNSEYNIVADIRMYDFFMNLDFVALTVIICLFLLSFVYRGFWCRYLCPYGALLGLMGLFSPNKIRRNLDTCINCGKCEKVCPSFIKVDKVKTVISDECTSCMRCVDACPVKDTLAIHALGSKKSIAQKWVAVAVIGVFLGFIGLGMVLNKWQNNVSKAKYLELYPKRSDFKHH